MTNARAATYARISLDRTGEAAGVERQRDDCTALVEQRGWTLAATFTDNSISAKGTRKRPGFESLLTAVERDEVDVIVAWAWDRLSRNRRDEVALIDACRQHHVSVALVRGAGDLDMSSAAGRFVAETLAGLGRMENDQKSERQCRALQQRAAQGLPWGPVAAFGYAVDRVTVVEDEAALIRAAYSAVLTGKACRSIAREWNAAGVPTRTDGPWSGSAVRRVLINPRYMGTRATTVGCGNRRDLREVKADAWDAVVSEDTWRAVHAILTDPGRTTTTTRVRVHLLAGLARCGVEGCGASVRSYTHSRGWPAYSCATSRHLVRKAAPVEDLVERAIIARLSRPDARDLLVDDDRPDAAALREQALALRARIAATRAAFIDDDTMTPEALREVLSGLQRRLAEAEEAMQSTTRAPVLADLVTADDVRATWDGLGLDRRRAVVDTLITVTILPTTRKGPGFDPESVRIDWRS